MGDVVSLKQEQPVGVFVCAVCKCESFTFRTNHVITCCGCDKAMSIEIFDGKWVSDTEELDDDSGRFAVRVVNNPTPEFVLRRALMQLDKIVHVIVLREDGGLTTWGNIDKGDHDRKAWLMRRLREAVNLITGRGKHGEG